jgi:uncharacterized protein YjiS (DUF1127 family)
MTRWLIASPWRLLALLVTRPFGWRLPWTLSASRQRRLGRATRVSLQALDARTLRDLGIDPGEIPFLAARVGEGRILDIADRAQDYMRL